MMPAMIVPLLLSTVIVILFLRQRRRRRRRTGERDSFSWIETGDAASRIGSVQIHLARDRVVVEEGGVDEGGKEEGGKEDESKPSHTMVIFGEALTIDPPLSSPRRIRDSVAIEAEEGTIPPTPNSTTFLNTTFDPPSPPSSPLSSTIRHSLPAPFPTTYWTGRKFLSRFSAFLPFDNPSSVRIPIPTTPILPTLHPSSSTTPKIEMIIDPFHFSVDQEFRKIRQSCPAFLSPSPLPPPTVLHRSNSVASVEGSKEEEEREERRTPVNSRFSSDLPALSEEGEEEFIDRYMHGEDDLETMEEGTGREIRSEGTKSSALDVRRDSRSGSSDYHDIILPTLPYSHSVPRPRPSTSSDQSAPKIELKLGWGRRAYSTSSNGSSIFRSRSRGGLFEGSGGVPSIFSSDSSTSIREFRDGSMDSSGSVEEC